MLYDGIYNEGTKAKVERKRNNYRERRKAKTSENEARQMNLNFK